MNEKKELYREIIAAVRNGEAKNFILDNRYHYPDLFFEIGSLRVAVCTGTGKVGVQNVDDYHSYDAERMYRISRTSYWLRQAIRKAYPVEYRQFFSKKKKLKPNSMVDRYRSLMEKS